MNLNENPVQIIDSLKTEFLRINETNKQHKVGKLINFNQMASDREERRKKRDEDRAISKANKSRCKEEFYKAIDNLNEDLNYVGLEFKRDEKYIQVNLEDSKIKIKAKIHRDEVDYGGYFDSAFYNLDAFHFLMGDFYWDDDYSDETFRFDTIEELANSDYFIQFVKNHGDFDSAAIHLSDQKEVSHA